MEVSYLCWRKRRAVQDMDSVRAHAEACAREGRRVSLFRGGRRVVLCHCAAMSHLGPCSYLQLFRNCHHSDLKQLSITNLFARKQSEDLP